MNAKTASIIAVVAGAVACAVAASIDLRSFAAMYLVAVVAWSAIPIGALAVLMISYLVRGHWTEALHRPLVTAALTIPASGLLFIPVLALGAWIFPWRGEELSGLKAVWFVPSFYIARTVLYFAIWTALAIWTHRAWADPSRMQRAASAGLIIYALSASWAGVDWMESLTPEFHSSGYGLIVICFQLLAGLGFVLLVTLWRAPPGSPVYSFGPILLSTVLLWAYLQAMQYIIIWAGNIPEEVIWYIKRSKNGWGLVLIVLVAGQFLIPFFAMLLSRVRYGAGPILWLAALTLLMRFVEAFWLMMPGTNVDAGALLLLSIPGALVFVGGVWLGVYMLISERVSFRPHAVRSEAAFGT